MENLAATLYCPNPRCQAPNPMSHNFCHNCRTPLVKRYLRAVGEGIEAYQAGSLLADRYLLKENRILLDTKPGLPPETPQEIPQELVPYLKLSPYRLHIPQLYGRLLKAQGSDTGEIWLLEKAPIYAGDTSGANSGCLMPELLGIWKNAPPLRQISWLWQIANLWQPLSVYGVASSLLSPTSLRVEGSLVRLLELQEDGQAEVTLLSLGELWSQWAQQAQPTVRKFIEQTGLGLVQGQIQTPEQLIERLDRGLKESGRSQERTLEIFTLTDKGPSRRRNEDACHPPSGSKERVMLGEKLNSSPSTLPLAIVCDGIGGHEGGDVASSTAIEIISQQVENLSRSPDNWNSSTLSLELERAALAANEAIGQRNDSEHRQDRQRMGTTLVMALARAHEIYITHVGDSRVYRITRIGCHQVTLDDDIASREMRLGYALYRDAVQQPTSGSLVQALGMGSSSMLHPTVQRFVLDEDCIFLLCSDGLTDNDRVEEYWETEIVPILEGKIDLATAGQRLVNLGNTQNGHDNVTVGLVYCQVSQAGENSQTELSVAQTQLVPPTTAIQAQTIVPQAAPSQMKTQQQIPQRSNSGGRWIFLLGFLLLGLLGGSLVYFLPTINSSIGQNPSLAPTPTNSSPPPSPQAKPSDVLSVTLTPGSQIEIQSSTTKNLKGQKVPLLLRPDLDPPKNQSALGLVPANSVLQIIDKQMSQNQESWLKLRVCSTGSDSPAKPAPEPKRSQPPKAKAEKPLPASNSKPDSATYRQVKQGEEGWIRESEVVAVKDQNLPNSTETDRCGTTPSVSPSPSLPSPP